MMTLVFVLCACKVTDKAEKISQEFSNAQKIVVTADIRADYGDKVFDFKITCTDTYEETAIEIRKPDELAGITAVCTDDGYELEYEGANFVTTGVLTRNGLSPAEALPCLIDMWRNGYVTGASEEMYGGEKTVVLDAHITERVTQRTWFDGETLLPIRSEIAQDGVCVITCEFENVIVE